MVNQKWKDIVKEENEMKVFSAMAESRYDFRSVQGISKSTGLTTIEVEHVLAKYPELVRKSSVPDSEGQDLYTLKEKPESISETLDLISSFASKSIKPRRKMKK